MAVIEKVIYSSTESIETKKPVLASIMASKFASEFQAVLERIVKKTTRHERVDVHFWYYPFVYIDVVDTRWKHYPCGHRFLVSFDLTNGKLASEDSSNRYTFARKGWRKFADELVGYTVSRYSDCGNMNKTERC